MKTLIKNVMNMLGMVSFTLWSQGVWASPQVKEHYVSQGQSHDPWVFSLQFGQAVITQKNAKTTKASLVASPSEQPAVAINLAWRPRGVMNKWGAEDKSVSTVTITNSKYPVDLSKNKLKTALLLDMRINKVPNKNVELTMQGNWDWQCRSTLALKNMLKGLAANEWLQVPVPIQCFDNDKFDLSKVTTPFMLYTSGRMDIDIRNITLVELPPGHYAC